VIATAVPATLCGRIAISRPHVMVTVGGPRYGPLLEMDSAQVRQAISEHVVLALKAARNAAGKMRPGGTLLLMGGTGGRRVGYGLGIASAATAALPPFTAALALELAPVRAWCPRRSPDYLRPRQRRSRRRRW